MIIIALFISDFYRSLVLSLLSILLTYGTRNSEIKKRIAVSCIYLACVAAGFVWVFLIISIWGESPAMEILIWGAEWSCFFLIITAIQHFVYQIFGEEKDIGLLVLNSGVVLGFCFIAVKCVIKI